jgi:SagB-type dehydrogenase family enzyme
VPWIWASPRHGEIGPVFHGQAGACRACARLAHVADPRPGAGAVGAGLFAGLLAGAVVHLLSRVAQVPVLRSSWRWEPGTLLPSRAFIPRDPACPVCCPLPGDSAVGEPGTLYQHTRAGSAAISYEQFTESSPPELLDPRAHRLHYEPAALALSRQPQRWPTVQGIPLPAVTMTGDQGRGAGLARAGLIAGLVAGLRETNGATRRWAPTGGNLGSPQLYWVETGHGELARGIYGYDAPGHRLVCLGGPEGVREVEQCMSEAGAGLAGNPAPVVAYVVLTAALHRVARKYHAYAYRLVHLDAGCALAQLRLVCLSLGLRTELSPRWDDERLGRCLRMDPAAEPVTAVAALKECTVPG